MKWTFYRLDDAPISRDDPIYWHWQRSTLSAMFMPAWAARDFIKITTVKAERLQDITEEDAQAEGITEKSYYGIDGICHYYEHGYVCSYQALWDSINKKPGTRWADNPYIWAYSFERIYHV